MCHSVIVCMYVTVKVTIYCEFPLSVDISLAFTVHRTVQHSFECSTQVEQFWKYYSHLTRPNDLSGHCDYHLFKRGIKPMWEVWLTATAHAHVRVMSIAQRNIC